MFLTVSLVFCQKYAQNPIWYHFNVMQTYKYNIWGFPFHCAHWVCTKCATCQIFWPLHMKNTQNPRKWLGTTWFRAISCWNYVKLHENIRKSLSETLNTIYNLKYDICWSFQSYVRSICVTDADCQFFLLFHLKISVFKPISASSPKNDAKIRERRVFNRISFFSGSWNVESIVRDQISASYLSGKKIINKIACL